jgi:hypothetical protein
LRSYNIIFAFLALSIIVLGGFVYYLQSQVGTLSQETKSLSSKLNDARQEYNDLNSSLQHSLTLRTFNFTIVLSNTIITSHDNTSWSWAESAALENATLVTAGGTAHTLSLSDLITGSRPLDVWNLGFPYGKNLISYPPPPPNYTGDTGDYYHTLVKVNTVGYGFYDAVMNTTELARHENESGTFMVTYYTFTGQVDLLYPTLSRDAAFYFTFHPDAQFSIEWNEKSYKVVSLPSS